MHVNFVAALDTICCKNDFCCDKIGVYFGTYPRISCLITLLVQARFSSSVPPT